MTQLSELYTAFDSPPTGIVAFLQRLAAFYRLSPPLRVLDVGCGPGRLLRPLAQLHWDVTGMEPNPDFLSSARSIAEGMRRLRVRRGGFLEIDSEGEFGLVIGINSSFAHLIRPAERAEALERIHRALRPGGVVFLDLPNFPWILRHYQEPLPLQATVHGRSVTLFRSHRIDYHEATFTTTDRYVFAEGESDPVELIHEYGLVTLAELRHFLSAAGFAQVTSYNGYSSTNPEKIDGGRMLLAAQRPVA